MVGLTSVFPFTPIAAGVNVDILSLSFLAENLGLSTLEVVGFPIGSRVLALGGVGIDATIASATVNVVPEPATILLLASGLFGMGVFGRRKFRK